MRQALERVGESHQLNESARSAYVVTVLGLLPVKKPAEGLSQAQSKSDADDSPAARSQEEILEAFMSNSRLITKGRPSLGPQNIKFTAEPGGVQIFFARDPAIETKREILFVTRYGAMTVQARFRAKEMSLSGHPDL
jgi:hypothetical protein